MSDQGGEVQGWRRARGVLGPATEPAEVTIRRLRDGDVAAAKAVVRRLLDGWTPSHPDAPDGTHVWRRVRGPVSYAQGAMDVEPMSGPEQAFLAEHLERP